MRISGKYQMIPLSVSCTIGIVGFRESKSGTTFVVLVRQRPIQKLPECGERVVLAQAGDPS
jgi:hypothetical protein